LAVGQPHRVPRVRESSLNYRPAANGPNPKNGEKVQVPRKSFPHFKAGKERRERVDYHEGYRFYAHERRASVGFFDQAGTTKDTTGTKKGP